MGRCALVKWSILPLFFAGHAVTSFVPSFRFLRPANGCINQLGGISSASASPTGILKSTQYQDDNVVQEANTVQTVEPAVFEWSKQWYPLRPLSCLEDVANEPIPVQLLGRNLVLWKTATTNGDEQQWSVMEDECPHRRAPLSTGKVVGGSKLMCRFHGWEFGVDGSCENIPMFTGEKENLNALVEKDAFCVKSYPTREAGGLLWVYLGADTSQQALPEIPQSSIVPKDVESNADWLIQFFPITYMSMVENSFDPAHAPFIHEGIKEYSGGKYAPEGAAPMQQYRLCENTTITTDGFSLEHTPYQKSLDPSTTVIRQFAPPSLQKTVMPFFSIYLYFVPTGPRETMVLSLFPMPSFKWTKFLPSKFRAAMMDMIHFWFITSAGNRRFFLQDTVTMQGQDTNKLQQTGFNMKEVVSDMAPTPADFGINVFQRWVRKFGRGGPFSDSIAVVPIDSLQSPQPKSMWELHGKHCPKCKRSLTRLEKMQGRSSKAASLALLGSSIAAIVNSAVGRKLTLPLAGVFVSLVLRSLEAVAKKARARIHKSLGYSHISDVYAY